METLVIKLAIGYKLSGAEVVLRLKTDKQSYHCHHLHGDTRKVYLHFISIKVHTHTRGLEQGDIFSLKGCAKFFNEVEFLGTACLSIFKISQCVTVHTKLARVEKRTKLEA